MLERESVGIGPEGKQGLETKQLYHLENQEKHRNWWGQDNG